PAGPPGVPPVSATHAARRRAADAWLGLEARAQAMAASRHARTLAIFAVLVLVGLSAFLRTRAIGAGFWIDEGIAVGIASYPLPEIPRVLLQDGAPPLYYLLLHVWIAAFGDGEAVTHALSAGFAVLTVPAAFWAGRSLFGARAGWMAAIIAAVHPFLTYYAQETRMYTLVALLSLLACATFAHAFVHRRRAYLLPFAASLTLLALSHNWGLFLGLGTLAALVMVGRATADRRALRRDAALAYGVVALTYLPWVPSLVRQALSTGAPWSERPDLAALSGGIVQALGGTAGALAVVLVGGAGLWRLVDRDRAVTADQQRRRLVALTLITVTTATLAGAWLSSQVSPGWAVRYMAVVVGPAMLIVAVGLAHARRLGLVALVLLAVGWFDPRVGAIEGKSNARQVTTSVEYRPVGPGDLVVSTQPERVSTLSYYLGDEYRYATSLGPVADPRVFDWRGAVARLKEARPTPTADPLVESLAPGRALILVQPIVRTQSWDAPWTSVVRRRVAQWEEILDEDPRLRRSEALPEFGFDPLPRGVRAVIYRKR
ncbi:MAG TPA: glycosyltransferase family 39 protein, partial [Solirubrobacteraceae bacterium]|nr:glycosyltransferase family 39 protein [Solirubrobacteraceae bacterium]